jgi:hypothetical protein
MTKQLVSLPPGVLGNTQRLYRWGVPNPGMPGRIPSTVGPATSCKWVEAADNPFQVRLLDCRPYTQAAVCVTSDEDEARRFGALRAGDGSEHRGRLPDRATEYPCRLEFPSWDRAAEGPLFLADEMEDKWDLFRYDDRLYFADSWTGRLRLVAETVRGDQTVVVVRVFGPESSAPLSPPLAVRQADYLLKSHAFNAMCPHTVPPDVPPEPGQVATYSFVTYGRRAYFASYEDTTAVRGAQATDS